MLPVPWLYIHISWRRSLSLGQRELVADIAADTIFNSRGSWAFLIGSYLQLYESLDKHPVEEVSSKTRFVEAVESSPSTSGVVSA